MRLYNFSLRYDSLKTFIIVFHLFPDSNSEYSSMERLRIRKLRVQVSYPMHFERYPCPV